MVDSIINNKDTLSYFPKAFVGKSAPNFEGDCWNGKDIKKTKLSDYKGKWVVLFFYPLDFTFVCPTEICNFSDAADKFRDINAEIIGCSIDSAFSHREYALKPRKNGGLAPVNIPLLSDISHEISKDYGVYVDSGKDKGVALRGTFIIDGNGFLKHSSVNDLSVGRNVDETLRLVQAFQYTEKYGEVCPSKWKPGDRTMKPDDPEKLNKYWEEVHGKENN